MIDTDGTWQSFPVRFGAELHCLTGDIILSFDRIVPEGSQFWEQVEAVFVKAEGDEQHGQRSLVISQGSTPYDLADNDTRIVVQQLPEPFPPFLQASLTEELIYNGFEDVLVISLPLTGRTFDASSVTSLVWSDSLLPDHPVDLTPQIDEWGNFSIDRVMIESIFGMPLPQDEHTITQTSVDGAGIQNELDLTFVVDELAPTHTGEFLITNRQPSPQTQPIVNCDESKRRHSDRCTIGITCPECPGTGSVQHPCRSM